MADSAILARGNRHGPGGGGEAVGVIFVSGAPASASVSGGASDLTLTPGVPYPVATAGNPGASGDQRDAYPGHGGSIRGSVHSRRHAGQKPRWKFHPRIGRQLHDSSFECGCLRPNQRIVTINDTLPTGITPTSAAGTGWTCSVSAANCWLRPLRTRWPRGFSILRSL